MLVIIIYGFFLGLMALSSILTYQSKEDIYKHQYILRILGSFIFVGSDLLLIYKNVNQLNGKLLRCFIELTYHLAQFFITQEN